MVHYQLGRFIDPNTSTFEARAGYRVVGTEPQNIRQEVLGKSKDSRQHRTRVTTRIAGLLQELRRQAKQRTVNEIADLLKASLANTSKLKSIKEGLLDDHPNSSSQKRKADTAELLKGAEDFLDRCKRLKAQVEADEE